MGIKILDLSIFPNVPKLFFLLLFSVVAFAQVEATKISPLLDTLQGLRIEKSGGVDYVDGVDLGKKLNLQMNWLSEAGVLQIDASSWVVGNEWASLKDTSFLLQAPVQSRINGKLSFWLPLPSSLLVFEQMLDEQLPKKDIWSANLESKNNGDVFELKFSKPFKVEPFYAHPNYILRINGAKIDSAMFLEFAKKSTFISRVVPIQNEQSAQITLTLSGNIEAPELVRRDDGKTLQVVLRRKAAAKVETPTPAPTQSKKIKTIVIDPGHGGKDPGAVGHKGLQEKDVVLSVGLKLKKKLEDKGFTVKMTRSKDEFVELSNRPKMASDWGGDLFISLHCNAIEGKERQQRTEGFKFYILRAGGTEEDKAIARRENQAILMESGKKGKTEISPAEWIILDNQLALYAERSALLAGHLVEAFDGGTVKKQGTGAGQAGFMVLVGAYMPAVLAELGFITHPADGAYMATDNGQNELADRLAKAIVSFAK